MVPEKGIISGFMMKKTEYWGDCPYRYVGWARNGGGWSYICGKNDDNCRPDYCLGPDEDEKESKNED